ncbi:MAG: phosphotransferase [Candidatus Schekmanbacteria bacterium]|nr:phosphotransferase [Candidatus Schekmanbacteria bacterium]
MAGDGRPQDRYQVSPRQQVSATLQAHGRVLAGKVAEIGQSGFAAVFEEFPYELGDALSLTVSSPRKTVEVRNVEVREVAAARHGFRVSFVTNDPRSRARLWSISDELRLNDRSGRYKPIDREAKSAPRVPLRGHYSRQSWEDRVKWLESFTGTTLEHVRSFPYEPEALQGNIENFVGGASIPLGAAGPLLINGRNVTGYVVAPFATTEGALVASATRGATALSRSGGVFTRVFHQQMIRAPIFFCGSMEEAYRLQCWIADHREGIREQVKLASKYAELVSVEPFQLGNMIHLRFVYRTGDAAGQNMTTIVTWKVCQWMLRELASYPDITVENFIIEANMSGDKKVSLLNFIEGRGIKVIAEALIPDQVLERVLKVQREQLLTTYHAGLLGGIQIGMIGANVNIANVIAAMFAATGQDIGCVHESSLGIFTLRQGAGGVYASMVLPTLIIGTIGGGTALPTQKECLQMLGCYGTNRVFRLAEIIAGFCLALDLSTMAAIAAGHFATAHERLGRNRPTTGLRKELLTPALFARCVAADQAAAALSADALSPDEVTVTAVTPVELDTSSSILTELGMGAIDKMIGHYPLRVSWCARGRQGETKLVLKSKPTDAELIRVSASLAHACGGQLAVAFDMHRFKTGARRSHIRELAIADLKDPRYTEIAPKTLLTWRDDRNEIFVLAMEYLEGLSHMNTVDDIAQWTPAFLEVALRDIARFHSLYLGDFSALLATDWIDAPTAERIIGMTELWEELLDHNAFEFPEIFTPIRVNLVKDLIVDLPEIWGRLEEAPRTLVHNDFNPRNIAIRATPDGPRLCAYDWELATIHVPQHDVAELLSFVLPPEASADDRWRWVDFYRRQLESYSGTAFDPAEFREVFDLACYDLAINRLALYCMAHTFKEYSFLERVLHSHFRYLESELQW